jgi:Ca2+-binding RTX toxin-like protein
VGGQGKDILTGGLGADTFDFNSVKQSAVGIGRDVVNFSPTEGDRIDLSGIDADKDGTAGDQAFTWSGSDTFSNVDGQLRFADGLLQGDINGDGKADFEILIRGMLTASDIIL